MTSRERQQMEKPWLKHYPEQVPENVDVSKYASLAELIETKVSEFSDRDAFSNMGSKLTYGQVDILSRDMAAFFQNQLGLKKGDKIAIMMPNLLQYPIALFAAVRAGLIVANVNPLYTPRELRYQLKDCGAKTIIILDNFAHVLAEVVEETEIENIILTKVGDQMKFPVSYIANFVTKYIKKMVPSFSLAKASVYQFNQALSLGSRLSFKRPEINPEDIVFLQYTGGTTGLSKGAMISNSNICANITQVLSWFTPFIDLSTQKVVITPLPLYHMFALMANCLLSLSLGGINVLITNPRDIPGLIKEMSKWKFSAITGVNTLFNAFLHFDEFKKLDFSHLEIALGGGMACQRSVAEEWQKITGKPLFEAYGLTEASPTLTMNPFNQADFTGWVGLPLPNTLIEIRDENGELLPANTPGEIWAKGPQVMQGYWQKPEETRKTLTEDGWLRTGDIAIMDERGYVKLVDRKKDMIIVSGFNVYPNEIEDVVASHPGIVEAAAIGAQSAKSGEVVKIIAVKKDPELDEQGLIAFCRQHLTGYKVPKIVEFRDELPKSNVGKILRRELREEGHHAP